MTVEQMKADAARRASVREALPSPVHVPMNLMTFAEALAEAKAEKDRMASAKRGEVAGLDDDEVVLSDIFEAIGLLKEAMTLLDYLADEKLCPQFTIHDRKACTRQADKMGGFLNAIEGEYE